MMTKEQFDDDFIHGRCLVQATTMDEWLDLNEYAARELGVKKSDVLHHHSFDELPYVGVRSDNRVAAWHDLPSGVLSVVPFGEFQSVIQEDNVMELYAAELGDIL